MSATDDRKNARHPVVPVRLPDPESREALVAASTAAGLSVSAFARRALLAAIAEAQENEKE
jgi:hypothetical protein